MSSKRRLTVAFLIALALVPVPSMATIIIDGSTPGFYNNGLGNLASDSVLGAQTDTSTGFNLFPANYLIAGDPTIPAVASEPNLAGADASTQTALGSFLGNTTTLGGSWSVAPQAIPATWVVDTETAIVYEINAGATGFDNLRVEMGVDNGVYAWLDGVYKFGAMAPGIAFAGEYAFDTGPVSPGIHFLQFLREDHGRATGWIVQADATIRVRPESIPEPATLALIGLGLAGLSIAVQRRRRFNA